MSQDKRETTGMDQVNGLLARGVQPPFGQKTGISLVEAEEGHAVFTGTPNESDFNPMGTVHGGYVAAMLDSACGIAAHTGLRPGQGYTTAELKVSFIKPLGAKSGTVKAVGKLIAMGRRAAFAEASLFDESGKLCATATSTLIVFETAK